MVSSSVFIVDIQLLPRLTDMHIETKYIDKKKSLTFAVNWYTTIDWYGKVVASTTSLMRIRMCVRVFLERDRKREREKKRERKDGKYLLNSVAILTFHWLDEV